MPADASPQADVPKPVTAYSPETPDPAVPAQRVTAIAAPVTAPGLTVKALPPPHNPTVSEAVDAWRNEGDPN